MSCYHLTIEDGTYFGHLEKKKKIKRIEDDVSQQEFRWISEKLKSKNYQHYEISNFAIQGKESFHNSNYWNQSSYIGLGPGAHSFRNSTRRWNISNNRLYIKNIKAGIHCPDGKTVKERFDMGYNLGTISADAALLSQASKREIADAKK